VLRFKTLGQVFLERDGSRVAGAAAQPRRLALLAILAAAGSRGVSRDRLIGLLWLDSDEEKARKGLNQALYALRQEIGSDDAITGTRDLVLAPELVRSDIAEFRAAFASGDLEKAAGIYEGQFLDGFHLPGAAGFERWMEGERSALARDHATALERLARRAEDRHDDPAAIDWWRRLASLDPLDGKTTLRLMEALVRAGDRVGALKQARIYEVLLSQELELPPDHEVIALAERIRATEAVPTPTQTPAVSVPAAARSTAMPMAPAASPLTAGPAVATLSPNVAFEAIPSERFGAGVGVLEPLEVGLPERAAAAAASDVSATPGVTVSAAPAQPAAVVERIVAPAIPRPAAPPAARGGIGAARLIAMLLAAAALGATLMARWRSAPESLALGATRKITLDAGLEVDPVLAPDGRTLAYAAGPEGSMRIYVRRLDGGRAVRVSAEVSGDHRRPRWSPDGSRLLYQAGGGIWMVPALGGVARPVVAALPSPSVRALYPEWSPDGQRLAWVRRDSILVRSVGGGSTTLVGTLPEAHSLAWSPDGKWIAAVSGNEGFVYGAAASTMDVGFISIGNLAPSSVWVIPSEGGEPVRVAGGDYLNTSPAWLGSGRLVFVSDREGSRDLFVANLDRAGEPVGAPRRLTTGLNAHTVSVQRDGKALAYSVFTQTANVWAVPIPTGAAVGTTGATPITSGSQTVEAMEVSPDGKWLAFDADGAGSQDIYRLPLGGGDVERIVESPTDDHRPFWAPDGQSILFYAFVGTARRAFVAPVSGGEPRMLQPGGRDEQHTPVWSPDMRHVLFHRAVNGGDQIFELTKSGDSTWGPARQLTKRGGFGGRWSPDGAHLAYVAPPRQVRLMGPGDDGEATSRVLYGARDSTTARPVAIRWSPDGRSIYMKTFDAGGQAALWSLGLDGGPPRLLVKFDEPLRPARRPEFAVDAKRLYFTLAQSESDVWVMGVRDAR
jgi:Tol biopolymer transport system component/DNA-binding SARP family transcriptional activator